MADKKNSKIPNLDLLADAAGRAVLLGVEREILQLDGGAYRALYELEAQGNTDVRPLYDVVARIVPTLTREEVDRLTAKQIGAVLAIAGHSVAAVEDEFPNADGPETPPPTATSPA